MIKRFTWGVCCVGLALGLPSLGCAVAHEEPVETANVGTAKVALLGTSRSGVTYRLTGANLRVVGPTSTLLSGDDDTLSAELIAGDYTVELEAGWLLSEVRDDGSLRPVEAELASPNPIAFTIVRSETTEVSFVFRVKGENVSLGRGTLLVGIEIDDGLVDDFEDGDGLVSPIGGRNGAWFVFNDGTGVQSPEPGIETLPEPNAEGGFSLQTSGDGFVLFGAGVGASLAFSGTSVLPYDASSYGGVRFRVRSSFDYRFGIGTLATTPVADGGTCLANCFDDHVISLGATDSTTVEIRFTDLAQLGFGTPAAFVSSEVLFLKWFFPPGLPFDVEIDDVELVP